MFLKIWRIVCVFVERECEKINEMKCVNEVGVTRPVLFFSDIPKVPLTN